MAVLLLFTLPGPGSALEAGTAFAGPSLGPVPIEFILFGVVLAGVALFHKHALGIALAGAIVIALYKIVASPFATSSGRQRPSIRASDNVSSGRGPMKIQYAGTPA